MDDQLAIRVLLSTWNWRNIFLSLTTWPKSDCLKLFSRFSFVFMVLSAECFPEIKSPIGEMNRCIIYPEFKSTTKFLVFKTFSLHSTAKLFSSALNITIILSLQSKEKLQEKVHGSLSTQLQDPYWAAKKYNCDPAAYDLRSTTFGLFISVLFYRNLQSISFF